MSLVHRMDLVVRQIVHSGGFNSPFLPLFPPFRSPSNVRGHQLPIRAGRHGGLGEQLDDRAGKDRDQQGVQYAPGLHVGGAGGARLEG